MVNNIRKIWMVVVFNFRRWRYDRKIWLAFILNFIMCYFLTEKILQKKKIQLCRYSNRLSGDLMIWKLFSL